jgi:hypothetical protein
MRRGEGALLLYSQLPAFIQSYPTITATVLQANLPLAYQLLNPQFLPPFCPHFRDQSRCRKRLATLSQPTNQPTNSPTYDVLNPSTSPRGWEAIYLLASLPHRTCVPSVAAPIPSSPSSSSRPTHDPEAGACDSLDPPGPRPIISFRQFRIRKISHCWLSVLRLRLI